MMDEKRKSRWALVIGILLCIGFLVATVWGMLIADLGWWQSQSNRDGLIVTLLIIILMVQLMKR